MAKFCRLFMLQEHFPHAHPYHAKYLHSNDLVQSRSHSTLLHDHTIRSMRSGHLEDAKLTHLVDLTIPNPTRGS